MSDNYKSIYFVSVTLFKGTGQCWNKTSFDGILVALSFQNVKHCLLPFSPPPTNTFSLRDQTRLAQEAARHLLAATPHPPRGGGPSLPTVITTANQGKARRAGAVTERWADWRRMSWTMRLSPSTSCVSTILTCTCPYHSSVPALLIIFHVKTRLPWGNSL